MKEKEGDRERGRDGERRIDKSQIVFLNECLKTNIFDILLFLKPDSNQKLSPSLLHFNNSGLCSLSGLIGSIGRAAGLGASPLQPVSFIFLNQWEPLLLFLPLPILLPLSRERSHETDRTLKHIFLLYFVAHF